MVIDLDAMEKRIAQHVALLLEQSIGDDVMTVEDAATFLHLSETTVRVQLAGGLLPGRRLGGQWRLRRSALLNFITNTAEIGVRQPQKETD